MPHPAIRRALAVLTACVALLLAAGPAASAAPPQHRPLDILITNDDGWIGPNGSSTPLIVALRDALAADGNNVTVVAPATDQSGTGTKMTFGTPLELLNPSPGVWTVSGSPSDAVYLGRYALFANDPPDLVLSGINPGGNHSSVANHSGTVSAAVAGLELGIPSIAVSVNASREGSVALKDTVARYAADLVDSLADHARSGPILPSGIGLNVNYPGSAPATGTDLTYQDPSSYMSFGYANTTGTSGQPGLYTLSFGAPSAAPKAGSDWSALNAGKISITPITANRTASFGALLGAVLRSAF